MVTAAGTAGRTSTSFQLERSFTSLHRLWFCLITRSGLRDTTLDTPTASSGENLLKSFVSLFGSVLVTLTSLLCPNSLAIHPDKIRIATGQIAGVDKDGRVSTNIRQNQIYTNDIFVLVTWCTNVLTPKQTMVHTFLKKLPATNICKLCKDVNRTFVGLIIIVFVVGNCLVKQLKEKELLLWHQVLVVIVWFVSSSSIKFYFQGRWDQKILFWPSSGVLVVDRS